MNQTAAGSLRMEYGTTTSLNFNNHVVYLEENIISTNSYYVTLLREISCTGIMKRNLCSYDTIILTQHW